MNLTSIAALLQSAVLLLTGIQHNAHATNADAQAAIARSSQAVQQAIQFQVSPMMPSTLAKNNSIWPNIDDLYNSVYIGPDGGYVPLSLSGGGAGTVHLIDSDTSFGDVNGDGLDDAAVVVQRTHRTGSTTTDLAIMLNQNGTMFNLADAQLGDNVQILSHHIIQGGDIVLNIQDGNALAQTSTYQLLGSQLIKL